MTAVMKIRTAVMSRDTAVMGFNTALINEDKCGHENQHPGYRSREQRSCRSRPLWSPQTTAVVEFGTGVVLRKTAVLTFNAAVFNDVGRPWRRLPVFLAGFVSSAN